MIIPNLNISAVDTNIQLDKISEELQELKDECSSIIDEDKLIEEAFDVIQATFSLIFAFEKDEIELKKLWIKHVKKLNDRAKNKKIEVKNYIFL